MKLPYPRLRHSLVAAAALLAFPAAAQVPAHGAGDAIEPSSSGFQGPSTNTSAVAAANARRASATQTPVKDGPLARLDATLASLASDYQARVQSGARVSNERVRITALAPDPNAARELKASLIQLGLEPTSETAYVISGLLPVSELDELAGLPSLRSAFADLYLVRGRDGEDTFVSPLIASRASRVGAVNGEASLALRADVARDRFGVTGAGVCIGVMSDSYDALGGAAAGVASGDLPEGIDVLDDLAPGSGSDEGRAMMELAYDVAPGSDMAFHTAFSGFVGFSGGIVQLLQNGCEVIVDDIGLAGDPFFQDGVVAQAVDYVTTQGATYFSSAGNSANASYESDYRDSGVPGFFPGGGNLHDFDPGSGVDAFQNVVLLPGQVLRFAFQYDEPSVLAGVEFSEFPNLYGGAAGQAPTSDYDVFVFDGPSADAGLLAVSANNNPSDGSPFEFIQYANTTGAVQTVYVAFQKYEGENRRLKYVNFGGDRTAIQNAEYAGASTAFGHSNAAGAFATGAAAWFNTKAYSSFIDTIESFTGPASVNGFSSYGGLDIRLDEDGNRLASPVDRMKPNAVASDADNNTFFGGDSGVDDDAFPNFFGTSAAAPNAAAVAALAREAAPGASPAEIFAALEETAADLVSGAPVTTVNAGATPGFDDRTGNGLIRADLAIARLLDVEPVECSTDLALSFDFNGDGAVDGADFELDGVNDPNQFLGGVFGELVAISNSSSSEIVDLSGCTFAVFNPFTERVIYTASPDAVIGSQEEFVFATQRGDAVLPPGVLPDGPGAFALVEGNVAVGARVRSVLGSVVASVVYLNDQTVFGSKSGGANTARTAGDADQAFLDALARVRGEAAVAEGPVDVTLTASPNPVQGRLTVAFGAAEASPVRAVVYDALGREVTVLADRSYDVGRHEVSLDTAALPSGVYVVRVAVGADVQTAQVTVIR